jgi:hypothetical protein
MSIKRPLLYLAQPPGTLWTRSLKPRCSTCCEDNFRCQALLWHLIPLVLLRPPASRSTLSSSHVVPIVEPSHMAFIT